MCCCRARRLSQALSVVWLSVRCMRLWSDHTEVWNCPLVAVPPTRQMRPALSMPVAARDSGVKEVVPRPPPAETPAAVRPEMRYHVAPRSGLPHTGTQHSRAKAQCGQDDASNAGLRDNASGIHSLPSRNRLHTRRTKSAAGPVARIVLENARGVLTSAFSVARRLLAAWAQCRAV